jgi:hypothetical protein
MAKKLKPHASFKIPKTGFDGLVSTAFLELRETEDYVRWSLPFDGKSTTEANGSVVFVDDVPDLPEAAKALFPGRGTKYVIDACNDREWHAYRLEDVWVLNEFNQRALEE